uniref:Uncharacterized protein n=1 Tax=viral metagenome TaxID=1070528 RepID=A0A6C0D014_9ZZZZ
MSITPFGCRQEPLFDTLQVPNQILNPGLDLVPANDFYPQQGGYTSEDPRLLDPTRGIRLVLDRPAVQPRNVQPLTDIAIADLPPNQAQYQNYTDINLGNRTYKWSDFRAVVYPNPVYTLQSNVEGVLFTDPMGSLKPYYLKHPLTENNSAYSDYTWDQDQLSFREDIMARQSQVFDKRRYTAFQSFFRSPPHGPSDGNSYGPSDGNSYGNSYGNPMK